MTLVFLSDPGKDILIDTLPKTVVVEKERLGTFGASNIFGWTGTSDLATWAEACGRGEGSFIVSWRSCVHCLTAS